MGAKYKVRLWKFVVRVVTPVFQELRAVRVFTLFDNGYCR
jgi:hypothetical protein